MRRKFKKKIKLSKKIIIISLLIITLTTILINMYSKKASKKIEIVMEQTLKKYTNNFLSNNISYDILNKANLDNILIINKNKDGEILYVDYNLDKAYEALEVITDVIYEDILDLESGMFNNLNLVSSDNGLLIIFPFFIYSNNPLLASLGPKIYAKVDFVSSILTNIKSKITNYGFNNALVELFVTIEISELVTSPVSQNEVVISYDVLVASKVINGRVPKIYGGIINENSRNLDIPIT